MRRIKALPDGRAEKSYIVDGYVAEGSVCNDFDGTVADGGGLTLEIDSGEAGVFDQIYLITVWNQKGTFTEGKIYFDCAVTGNCFCAGQIDNGFTKGSIDGSVLQLRQFYTMFTAAERTVAGKAVFVCMEIGVKGICVATGFGSRMNSFGLAECLDQYAGA